MTEQEQEWILSQYKEATGYKSPKEKNREAYYRWAEKKRKEDPEYFARKRELNKIRYNENLEKSRERSRGYYHALTPEKKAARYAKARAWLQKLKEEKPETFKEYQDRRVAGNRERYRLNGGLTPEQKERKKIQRARRDMQILILETDEEREVRRKKRRDKRAARIAAMSDEERARLRALHAAANKRSREKRRKEKAQEKLYRVVI